MKTLITMIVAVMTISAPAYAGALSVTRLSEEAARFLCCGKEVLLRHGDMVIYKVDLPPQEESIYNDFCRWDALYFIKRCDDGSVSGWKFPPVCRIGASTDVLNEIECNYLSKEGILQYGSLFPHFSCNDARLGIAPSCESPEEYTRKAVPLDAMTTKLATAYPVTPKGGRAVIGNTWLTLSYLPAESAYEGYANNHPLLTLRELVPPYRCAAYVVDAAFPGFLIGRLLEYPNATNPDRYRFVLSEVFFGKDSGSERYSGREILVTIGFGGMEAKEVGTKDIANWGN